MKSCSLQLMLDGQLTNFDYWWKNQQSSSSFYYKIMLNIYLY